jgi:hypothetical protein
MAAHIQKVWERVVARAIEEEGYQTA